jgi:hypothetical protein
VNATHLTKPECLALYSVLNSVPNWLCYQVIADVASFVPGGVHEPVASQFGPDQHPSVDNPATLLVPQQPTPGDPFLEL